MAATISPERTVAVMNNRAGSGGEGGGALHEAIPQSPAFWIVPVETEGLPQEGGGGGHSTQKKKQWSRACVFRVVLTGAGNIVLQERAGGRKKESMIIVPFDETAAAT